MPFPEKSMVEFLPPPTRKLSQIQVLIVELKAMFGS